MSGMGEMVSKGSKMLGGTAETTMSARLQSASLPIINEPCPRKSQRDCVSMMLRNSASKVASTDVAKDLICSFRALRIRSEVTTASDEFFIREKKVAGAPIMSMALAKTCSKGKM